MVEFERYMSIALQQCAPTGEGSQDERREVFSHFVDEWNENKESIKTMSESQLKEAIDCP